MKILLLRFFHRKNATCTVPWHFSFFKDMLERKGHIVDIIDNQIENYTPEELVEITVDKGYQLVGGGGMGTVYSRLKEFSTLLKSKKPEVTIVIGGQIVADYEFIMNSCPVDVLVLGEGEITLSKIVSCISQKGDYRTVPGIAFRKDGGIIVTGPERYIDMNELPDFNFKNLKIEKYDRTIAHFFLVDQKARQLKEQGHESLPIYLSRGCPYSCFFCYRQLKGYRIYNKERLEEILKGLKTKKYSFLFLRDACLTANQEYLKNICELTKKYEIYWAALGRVDHINPEILRMLKESNCVKIMYGIESFDKNMLRAMWKRTTPQQNINALNWSYQYGLSNGGLSLVLGAPGKNRNSLFNSRKGIWSCYFDFDVTRAGFLNPYPGTPAYYYGIEKGYIKDKEYIHNELSIVKKLVVNFSKLSRTELYTWQKWLLCEAAISYRIKHFTLKLNKYLLYAFYNFSKAYLLLLCREPLNFLMFNLYLLKGFTYWLKPVRKLKWYSAVKGIKGFYES